MPACPRAESTFIGEQVTEVTCFQEWSPGCSATPQIYAQPLKVGLAHAFTHSVNLSVAFMLGSGHVLVNKRFTLCAWIIYNADLASSGLFPIKCNVLTITKTFPAHCGFPWFQFSSVQFSRSVVSDSLRPHESQHCQPFPVHHQLPEFTQTHVQRVGDAIKPSHPL